MTYRTLSQLSGSRLVVTAIGTSLLVAGLSLAPVSAQQPPPAHLLHLQRSRPQSHRQNRQRQLPRLLRLPFPGRHPPKRLRQLRRPRCRS